MKKFVSFVVARDAKIFYILNSSIKCYVLDKVMPHVTRLGGVAFTVLLSLSLIFYSRNIENTVGYEVALTLSLSSILVQILKRVFARLRPFITLTNVNTFNFNLKDYSFPSGHTTAAFSISVILAIVFSQFAVGFLFMAFTVGFSRVYSGVHYPTDVLVGAVVGTISAILVHVWLIEKIIVKNIIYL